MASPKKYCVIVAAPPYRVSKLVYPNERGAQIVAAALRDAGFEVIYTDLLQPGQTFVQAAVQDDSNDMEKIADAALQYSADAIFISLGILHIDPFLEIVDCLKEKGMTDVLLYGGYGMGNLGDAAALQKLGISRVFGRGTTTHDVVKLLQDEIPRRRKTRA
jgi:methylmalonyl-CoA mutase, C-terminal domain